MGIEEVPHTNWSPPTAGFISNTLDVYGWDTNVAIFCGGSYCECSYCCCRISTLVIINFFYYLDLLERIRERERERELKQAWSCSLVVVVLLLRFGSFVILITQVTHSTQLILSYQDTNFLTFTITSFHHTRPTTTTREF